MIICECNHSTSEFTVTVQNRNVTCSGTHVDFTPGPPWPVKRYQQTLKLVYITQNLTTLMICHDTLKHRNLYKLIMKKTTSFSPHWLSDPDFSGWIGAVPDDKHRARCNACGCAFDLSNMGKRALQSHATGKKHQKALALMVTVKKEQNTLHSFFSKVPKAIPVHDTALVQEEIPDAVPPDLYVPPPPPLSVQQSAASTTNGSKQQCVLKVSSGDVLRAEVLWSIKVVLSHFSVNSCTGMPELFRSMFPDSSIAKEFKIYKTKCSYIICFGLAPYFKELFMRKLKEADCKFVISFDESLNRILQEELMDLIVHLWDKERQKVSMLYYGSKFLGHTTSKDLLSNFREALGALSMSNLVQIGMDGPHTNWKFFEDFVKEWDPDLPGLINLGCCSLHVLHGANRSGSNWMGPRWYPESSLVLISWVPCKTWRLYSIHRQHLMSFTILCTSLAWEYCCRWESCGNLDKHSKIHQHDSHQTQSTDSKE